MLDGRTIYTALIVLYTLALLWGNPKQYKAYTALFLLGIAYVAFHAVSIYDLNNYYAGQSFKAEMSLIENLQYLFEKEVEEPGAQLWFWLCSKFRYLGMLPAGTVLLFYGVMCALLFAVAEKENCHRNILTLAILFVICTTKYYSVLAGIRNHLGFMFFAVALVSELIFKKDWRLCWGGYFLALSFHTSILILIVLRLFLAVYCRYPRRMLMLLLLVASVFGYPIISFLANITGNGYLQKLADQTGGYYGGEGAEVNSLSIGNLTTAWVKLLCILLLLTYAYLLWRRGRLPRAYRSYLDYMAAILCFTIGASGSQHTLVRFPEFLGLLAAPLLLIVLTAGMEETDQIRRRPTCIRRAPPRYPIYFFWVFLLDSGMFFAFQFLGTLTLIGWQTPALLVGSIR